MMQTRKPLIGCVDSQLIEVHVEAILDKGLEPLIKVRPSQSQTLVHVHFKCHASYECKVR